MGSPTRERDAVKLVKLCQELWPRVISRTDFRDARLQSAEEREELLATAIAWVWEYRESLEGLSRADRGTVVHHALPGRHQAPARSHGHD